MVEMLKEKLLYAKLADGQQIIISQPGHFVYNPGEVHNFHFDVEALHYFDAETTQRIV